MVRSYNKQWTDNERNNRIPSHYTNDQIARALLPVLYPNWPFVGWGWAEASDLMQARCRKAALLLRTLP